MTSRAPSACSKAGGRRSTARGGMLPVLKWLGSLPSGELDARPELWVMWAIGLAGWWPDLCCRREIAGGRGSPAGRRAGRHDPRPAWADRRCQSHGGRRSLRCRNDHRAGRPRPGVSARPETCLPQFRVNVDSGHLPTSSRGTMRRPDGPMRKPVHRPGLREHSSIGVGHYRHGTGTGIGKRAASGCRELSKRSCNCCGDQPPPMLSEEYIGLARILQNGTIWLPLRSICDRACNWRNSMTGTSTCSLSVEVVLARLQLARGDAAEAAACWRPPSSPCAQNEYVQRGARSRCCPGADVACTRATWPKRLRWPSHTTSR